MSDAEGVIGEGDVSVCRELNGEERRKPTVFAFLIVVTLVVIAFLKAVAQR